MSDSHPSKYPWANKKLGQHFLRDKRVIEKITQDAVQRNLISKMDGILEIGPGPGVLTQFLAQHRLPLHVVERDERFIPYLTQWIQAEQITMHDALEVDLQALFDRLAWRQVWLVSNLPYNISVPLLMRFMPLEAISSLTLMFQREVADKLLAFDSDPSKSMGSLMALGQTYFDVKLLCQVSAGAFSPPPQVGSTVLSFIRLENPALPLSEFQRFEAFLRKLFQFKRKQIHKVLRTYLPKEQVDQALKNLQLSPTLRAEALNLPQVQLLYRQFYS